MGDQDPNKNKAQEGEEEDIDDTQYKHPKDAVLFAIELSDSMLTAPPADSKGHVEDSPMLASLKCAYELLTQRLITNPRDKTGILLFGSEVTKLEEDNEGAGPTAHPNSHLLVDLDIPSATEVRAIKKLIEDPGEFSKVMKPARKSLKLDDLFFNVNGILTTRAANFASKRLFLVTDNDNPHGGSKDQKHRVELEAKDLHGLGVDIELFPVTKPGQRFDRSKIYDGIVWSSTPSDPDAPAPLAQPTSTSQASAGVTLLKALLTSVLSKAAPKRALFSNMPMELGPDLVISVKGYIIFKRQEKGKNSLVYVGEQQLYQVKPVTTKLAEDSAQAVEKDEVRQAYRFGGTQIVFTQEEVAHMRNFGEPVIRIIVFKKVNEDTLPIWQNCKHATFIYPSEEAYVGSTRVFAALRQKLKKSNKMALAWFVARKNAVPVMAAIIPGDEKLNGAGEAVVPAGLWLLPLPFADDIRSNPENRSIPAPDELIDHISEAIKTLRLSGSQYNPENYPNPDLQKHFRMLQMVALDEPLDGDDAQVEDRTIPRYKSIARRAGALVLEWKTELEPRAREWQEKHRLELESAGAKRGLSSADDWPRNKAQKTQRDVSDARMRQLWEHRSISELKVPELKAFLTGKGLPATGRKADLVTRIEHFYG